MLSLTTISVCSILQGGKLLAPEIFGLTPVALKKKMRPFFPETLCLISLDKQE